MTVAFYEHYSHLAARPDWYARMTARLWQERWRGRRLTAQLVRRLREMAGDQWPPCRAYWLAQARSRRS